MALLNGVNFITAITQHLACVFCSVAFYKVTVNRSKMMLMMKLMFSDSVLSVSNGNIFLERPFFKTGNSIRNIKLLVTRY